MENVLPSAPAPLQQPRSHRFVPRPGPHSAPPPGQPRRQRSPASGQTTALVCIPVGVRDIEICLLMMVDSAGATCKTENDCDGQLGCVSGKCANVGANPVVSTPRPVQPTPTRPGVITVTDTRSAGTPAVPSPTRPVGGGGGSSPQPCGDSPLACIGASCKSDADCGFTLIICDNGVCGL